MRVRRIFSIRFTVFVFVHLFMLARGARAHPLLQDRIEATLVANHVDLDVYSSLRSVVVSTGKALGDANYVHAPELQPIVERHAEYLLRHLKLAAGNQLLVGHVVSSRVLADPQRPIHRTIDLEKVQAKVTLSYPLLHVTEFLTLHHDCLAEFQYAPATPWNLSYQVFLRTGDKAEPTYRGLLRAHERLRLQAPTLQRSNTQSPLPHQSLVEMLKLGILHILLGVDHLLFVLALMLGAIRLSRLLGIVAAFTLAHSTTLLLAALNLLYVPPAIVEPLIAASIVIAAFQAYLSCRSGAAGGRAYAGWRPFAVAFVFGLFHGLGFARGLSAALGKASGSQIVSSILAFSVGIELGHLIFVASAVAVATLAVPRPWAATCRRYLSLLVIAGGTSLLLFTLAVGGLG